MHRSKYSPVGSGAAAFLHKPKNSIDPIMKKTIFTALLAIGCIASAGAEINRLVVEPNAKGAQIPSTMYGLFFEDINYAADGGLYAEKIKNRSFDFPTPLQGWTAFGKVEVKNDGPFENNPNYVRLSPSGHSDKWTGLDNEGFFGVSFEKGKEYRFSVWARVPDGGTSKVRVELEDPSSMQEGQDMCAEEFEVSGKEWKKYTVNLTPSETVYKGKLRVFLCKPEVTVDLEHLSLFPADTWKGRENGLRKDLVQKLADLKPGVFRFPGGCIVEGTDMNTRYQWKNTVGPVENRPVNENRWHYTFRWRFFPDYFQSYGLGFYEYFLLSEDIGAEPLPILNVGLVCQYQNRDESAHASLDELQPFIDDVLDLIEFANGPVDSKWGKLRAEMGHSEPFNLKYVGIGNEQWGPEYTTRLEPFIKAVRAKYPEIKIVGSSGPNSEGEDFDYLWPEMKRLKADLVDEHFYRPESWFLAQGNRYDNYDRKGPKVFAGEYACHGKGKKWNHFNAALMEAAFMTGLERNTDIVEMATYAPLFAHVEGWQWRPDMIWYDNFRSMPTASYYVQQLYSLNKGTQTVPLKMNGKAVAGNEDQNGLFASAVKEEPSGDLIVKVANTSDKAQDLQIDFKGLKKNQHYTSVEITTLHTDNPDAENTLDNQEIVKPKVENYNHENITDMNVAIPAKTFAVYRFKK